MDILNIIGRKSNLFDNDISAHNEEMTELVNGGRFLIIGGAGSIGQAVTKEIFKRHPRALHIVDISENNIAELVRDIRSTLGYIGGDFRTFTIDCGSLEFLTLVDSGPRYDYILNLSALKHVRSERDPFTLMRLIEVNILNTLKIGEIAKNHQAKKYF
jgi:FlaA1/EpsC-like NDP-sugar epimerase